MPLRPKTYEDALEKARSRPQRPRAPLRSRSPLKPNPAAKARKAARNKKRAAREKLPSRKSLVANLHKTVSLIVRLRDKRCVICGSTEQLQCGHVFGRRSHGAAFDIEEDGNCHCQCAGCNKKHNERPWVYYKWFIGKFGQEVFDAMYRRWEQGHKYSRRELIDLLASRQAVLVQMQSKENPPCASFEDPSAIQTAAPITSSTSLLT